MEHYYRPSTNWPEYLESFGHMLLNALNIDPYNLPTDHNPICEAIKNHNPIMDDLIQKIANKERGFSRTSLAKLATLCQMVIFDQEGGPEGDYQPKGLRRHWYAWFKVNFAQPFADSLGDYEINSEGVREYDDRKWAGLLSTTYSWYVDHGLTYRDLWVEDASRMIEETEMRLFKGSNILICVEKDSLLSDFLAPARAIGARAVYSGKGKSSRAAIEKLLRDVFGWRQPNERNGLYNDPFEENPLVILHISDHDYDGEQVIGPTFGDQARRYTSNIYEARIGIMPHQVQDAGYNLNKKWYSVKVGNSGYVKWAKQKALFAAECLDCNVYFSVLGIDQENAQTCPQCGGQHKEISIKQNTPHGFEVEAMKTRDYYSLIVDALLQVLPFAYIISKLRDDCQADAFDAAGIVVDTVLNDNDDYQDLLEEIKRLEEIQANFRDEIFNQFYDLGFPHISDWRKLEDDPTILEFRKHAKNRQSTWRPFSSHKRTLKLVEWLQDEAADDLDELKGQSIEW